MPLWTGDDAFRDEKPLDIPKELWMMVDHLYRNACQQVGMHVDLNRFCVLGLVMIEWLQ